MRKFIIFGNIVVTIVFFGIAMFAYKEPTRQVAVAAAIVTGINLVVIINTFSNGPDLLSVIIKRKILEEQSKIKKLKND